MYPPLKKFIASSCLVLIMMGSIPYMCTAEETKLSGEQLRTYTAYAFLVIGAAILFTRNGKSHDVRTRISDKPIKNHHILGAIQLGIAGLGVHAAWDYFKYGKNPSHAKVLTAFAVFFGTYLGEGANA